MSLHTDDNMGLPRVSGKRRWSEAANGEDNVSCKILCTSPPHAICAEEIMNTSPGESSSLLSSVSTCPPEGEQPSDPEDEPFVDDEEDKDSGFIDGNSIDNSSSDDDIDSSKSASSPEASRQNLTSDPVTQMDVDEATLDASPGRTFFSQSNPVDAPSSTNAPNTVFSAENEITTVTCALSGAAISSSHSSASAHPATEMHPLPSYTNDSYSSRHGGPSWSCNFYDGSNPNTNKYMEISPSRGSSSQSIQCDENGKSYMELGSASLYPNQYPNDPSNFTTTTPSTYHTPTPPTSPYPQSATPPYYAQQPRQPYNNFTYSQSESAYCSASYETDTGYSYSGGAYTHGRGGCRMPQRCTSPYCDPTNTRPRPACYQQQRLSVFNMSMYKLNRFSRFPEPSLHRSVLICNTLRHIEKELQSEGVSMTSVISHTQPPTPPPLPVVATDSMPSTPAPEDPLPSMLHGDNPFPSPSSPIPSQPISYNTVPIASPHPFYTAVGELKDPSLRPYDHDPTQASTSEAHQSSSNSHGEEVTWGARLSGAPAEEKTEGINWCSVLLSSQSDMDSVNNNDCSPWSDQASSSDRVSHRSQNFRLPSLSVDDVLKSFPEGNRRPESPQPSTSVIEDMLSS